MSTERNEIRGRRVSIDLTPAATVEVDRLREATQLSTADLFRYALHLLRIYVDERQRGNSLYTARADNPSETQTRIELPLNITTTGSVPTRSELARPENRDALR
jgi:hypothetical protein